MKKPMVTLKNWYVSSTGDPYTPPEDARPTLNGDAYGHPRFPDGHSITTSSVVRVPFTASLPPKKAIRDGMIVETRNTLYKLSGVCPKYEKWCDTNSYSVRG